MSSDLIYYNDSEIKTNLTKRSNVLKWENWIEVHSHTPQPLQRAVAAAAALATAARRSRYSCFSRGSTL